MKKLTALLICAIILIPSLVPSAFASGTTETKYPALLLTGSPSAVAGLTRPDDLRFKLLRDFASCPEDGVDVKEFMIPYSEANAKALREFIWYDVPELFNVYGLSFRHEYGMITDVLATYRCSAENYSVMLAEAKKAALAMVEGADGLPEVMRALIIHDRLAESCRYDYSMGTMAYTMYGALVDHCAVCDGYSRAYEYMLRLLGMECEVVASIELNHSWNVVTVDGVRYHVDVTWDDLPKDGWVSHVNFLRSTAGIAETGHDASDYDKTPCDGRYDGAYWQCSESAFQLVGESVYYIDNKSGELIRVSGEEQTVMAQIPGKWFANETQFWIGSYSRLVSKDGRIFFTTPDSVCEYVPGHGIVTLCVPDITQVSENVRSVYGIREENGSFVLDVDVKPDHGHEGGGSYSLTVSYTHAPGDANCDGRIGAKDIAAVLQFIAGWDPKPVDSVSADVNGDGLVNAKDAAELIKYVTGWATVLGG